MAFSQSEQGYLSKDSRFHWVGIVVLKLEGALWRREWAQTELANMLLGGLAKEKGTVSTQDEYGRKQHGTCQTIQ